MSDYLKMALYLAITGFIVLYGTKLVMRFGSKAGV